MRFDTATRSATADDELFIHERNRDDARQGLRQIPSITARDVQRVATEHLRLEKIIIVAVGDAARIEIESARLNLGSVLGQPDQKQPNKCVNHK